MDAEDNDQILHWLLNGFELKALMGKQRLHKSSNTVFSANNF